MEVFRKFIKYGTDSSPLPTKVRKGRPTHIHAEDIWALPKWGRSKRLPGWPIASIAALKKSAPEARLSVERGVQKLIGQCPNAFCANVRPPESVRIYLPAELSGGLQLKKTPCR